MITPGRCFLIAEAGVNHNGSLDLALQLVDAAVEAGADAVKFQTFRAKRLVALDAPQAAYQQEGAGGGGTQFELLRRLELDRQAHETLAARCASRGICFLSTPFDAESVDLLATEIGVAALKLSSGEVTNALLLLAAARTGKPIFLSTGMSTLGEVEEALGALAFGYLGGDAPGRDAFREAFRSPAGKTALSQRLALLHCTTEYPAPLAEVNLRAVDTLRDAFGLPAGLSDHSPGIAVAVAAAARGAAVVEKHFTLDRDLPGPDHRASLEPEELALLVRSVREVEAAMGDGVKRPSPSESRNAPLVRRSLVAARDIRRGEPFTAENMVAKRPAGGPSPFDYWELLGRVAGRDYREDEPLWP